MLLVPHLDAGPVTGRFERRRYAGGIPLEVEGDGGRVAVGAPEGLVGVVQCGGVGLVADRPLLQRRDAVVFGPQRLALHDERIGAHGHVEVGHVQERSTGSRQRSPVPGDTTDDPVAREQTDLAVFGPGGEHPLLDRRVAVTGIFEAGHDRADYGAMIRYLSLAWIDALSAEVAASKNLRELAENHRINVTQIVRDGPGRRRHVPLPGRRRRRHVRCRRGGPTRTCGWSSSGTTAVAVATGELNAQEAFICGQILLFGDQQKLLDAQPVFGALDAVFAIGARSHELRVGDRGPPMPEMPEIQAHAERLTDRFAGRTPGEVRAVQLHRPQDRSPGPDDGVRPRTGGGRPARQVPARSSSATRRSSCTSCRAAGCSTIRSCR